MSGWWFQHWRYGAIHVHLSEPYADLPRCQDRVQSLGSQHHAFVLEGPGSCQWIHHGLCAFERIRPINYSVDSSQPSYQFYFFLPVTHREKEKKVGTSRLCVSSLRRVHANLLCIVPIFTNVRRHLEWGNRAYIQTSARKQPIVGKRGCQLVSVGIGLWHEQLLNGQVFDFIDFREIRFFGVGV